MREPRVICRTCGRERVLAGTAYPGNLTRAKRLLRAACQAAAAGGGRYSKLNEALSVPHETDLYYQAGIARFPTAVGQ